jgi:CBS domain-containing protein
VDGRKNKGPGAVAPEIGDEDIYRAMQEIPGYLDITPGDFKELYQLARRHTRDRLLRGVTAKDIMSRDPARVGPDTPLQEVAELMARRQVSGVPVVDDDLRVVGVISEKDFLRSMGNREITSFMGLVAACLGEKRCQAPAVRGKTAGDLMTSPPVTVTAETPILDIIKLFKEKAVNRAPVVDAEGRLAGIVSRGDLLELARLGEVPP